MPQRILLTGSNGLLGQKIIPLLSDHSDTTLLATSRGPNRHQSEIGYRYAPLDLTDAAAVQQIVADFQPTAIIHTAAQTQVDACEDDREGCDAINIGAVETLCDVCQQGNIRMVHISTDFVFDGADGPYSEEDVPNPVNYYGQSKLRAEQVIRERGLNHAILRTVLLYGITPAMSRSNIVLWAKKSLEEGKPIRVVTDQFRTPTLAEDLATASMTAALGEAQGIFHISGAEFLGVHEIAYRIADFWKLDKGLITEVDSSTLSQRAKRPPRTGFIIDKARRDLAYQPHRFEEGLALVDRQIKAMNDR